MPDSLEGAQGTYQLMRELGSGSYGIVWLAWHERPGADPHGVAVKMGPKGRDNEKAIQEEYELQREAGPHRNIVEPLELLPRSAGQHLPRKFGFGQGIVSDVAMGDMAEYLMRLRSCPDAELTQQWSRDMVEGIAHLHSAGIIHRDVKPANFLLFLEPGDSLPGGWAKFVVKLTDFGMARRLPRDAPRAPIRKKSPCFGLEEGARSLSLRCPMTARACTSWYRPPELLAVTSSPTELDGPNDGQVVYGTEVDVWGIGAVVYELLAGKPLARAVNGAGLAICLLGALGPCPSDAAFTQLPGWVALARAAKGKERRRDPLPQGEAWDVVRACLNWEPTRRPYAQRLRAMPWLQVLPHGAPTPGTSICASVAPSTGAPTPGSHTHAPVPDPPVVATAVPQAPADQTVPDAPFGARSFSRVQRHRQTRFVQTGCRCKGHCRLFQHRKAGRCDSQELVEGTEYCEQCLCRVYGCTRCKHKSDLCYSDKNVLSKASGATQLAALAAPLAEWMMPCDVIDWQALFPEIRGDLAICIVISLVKEPRATAVIVEQWRAFPPGYDAAALTNAILKAADVCKACASTPGAPEIPPHEKELEQLTRQGVARFNCLATTAVTLGVLRKAERRTARTIVLGLTGLLYDPAGDMKATTDFLNIVRSAKDVAAQPCPDAGERPDIRNVMNYARGVRRLFQDLYAKLGFGSRDGTGYVPDTVVRKLCAPILEGADWDAITMQNIRELSADRNEHLDSLPPHWSAAQLSAFVCDRPDWSLWASGFICLWGEVADKVEGAQGHVTKLCCPPPGSSSTGAIDAICGFQQSHGVSPHPYSLMQELGHAPVTKPRKRTVDDGAPAPVAAKEGRKSQKLAAATRAEKRPKARDGASTPVHE